MAFKIFLFLVLLPACAEPLSTPVLRGSPPVPLQPGSAPTLPPLGTFYTTIAELARRPHLLAGQQVRIKGRLIDIQPLPSKDPTTSLILADESGKTVRVRTQEHLTLQKEQEVLVEGRIVLSDAAQAHPRIVVTDARILSASDQQETPPPSVKSPPQRLPPKRSPVAPTTLPEPSRSEEQKDEEDKGRIF